MGRNPKPTTATIAFEAERKLPIGELELDMSNNRITHLKINGEQELENKLWIEGKLNYLKKDIKARGLQEPLILFPNSSVVAEGNCRLVCLKRLHREAKTEENKNESPFESDSRLKEFLQPKVPCKRIARDTPVADIDAYLTEVHIGRKRKWPEYNQAKLLHKLKLEDDLTLEEIARISRSSRPTVSRKIEAYQHTSKYHEMFPDDEDFVKWFYYFWELTGRSLDKFRLEDANVAKFMKWVHGGKFSTSIEIRELPKVLGNNRALKRFEETGMTNAVRILMKVDPTIRSPLYRKICGLTGILENFPVKEVSLVVGNSSRKMALVHLRNSTIRLLKYIDDIENEGRKME